MVCLLELPAMPQTKEKSESRASEKPAAASRGLRWGSHIQMVTIPTIAIYGNLLCVSLLSLSLQLSDQRNPDLPSPLQDLRALPREFLCSCKPFQLVCHHAPQVCTESGLQESLYDWYFVNKFEKDVVHLKSSCF